MVAAPNIPVLTEQSNEQQPSLTISNRTKDTSSPSSSFVDDNNDEAPSTPPPPNDTPSTPPPPDDTSEIIELLSSQAQSQSLEDRVADLESKLATLSHLLSLRPSAAFVSSPSDLRTDSPSLNSTCPPLDSPHPVTDVRRRLSAVLLRENEAMTALPDLTTTSHPKTVTTNSTNTTTDADDNDKHSNTTDNNNDDSSVRQKWMDYLESFQESTPNVDVQMQEFVRVPSQLESLLTFGLSICVDSYLYILTMLPIKFVWSILLLIRSVFAEKGKYKYHRRHFYNMIQVCIIFFVYRFVLIPISIGQLYHWIRGQAMLKLYVLIAIVEVFDRLMCSMGQDCLDSMYWNTTRRPRSMRMLVSVAVVLVYTICHTLILFVHVATLNVAINSADHALLSLLISGNFAEIKSTVFKKYNKPNLFKITASDICERFKLALFLTLVLMLNMCQGMDSKMTYAYLSMSCLVYSAELLADWMKHSFITKFNFIPSKVYAEYALLLAGDVTGIGHEGVNLDHSHAVVKRIGFAQIPLVCVMLRLVTEAFRYSTQGSDDNYLKLAVLTVAVVWGVLFGIKLLLGSYLQRVCAAKLEAAPEIVKTPKKKKKDV